MTRTLTPAVLGSLVWPNFRLPPHLQQLQTAYRRLVTQPDYNRIDVEAPPRHGKSLFTAQCFPSWCVLARPELSGLILSADQDLADSHLMKIREIIEMHGRALTGVALDPRYRRRDYLVTNKGGRWKATGRGGRIAGEPAHIVIMDDLWRSQAECDSATIRETVWNWFFEGVLAREEPHGFPGGLKILQIGTRRRPDDLQGRCLEMNPGLPTNKRWHQLRFPAISIGIDGREQALWPQRFPLHVLRQKRDEYQQAGLEFLWNTEFQQDASYSPEGMAFPPEYFKGILIPAAEFDAKMHSLPIRGHVGGLDPSQGSDNKQGDYSAWSYSHLDEYDNWWVEDSWLQILDPPAIAEQSAAWMQRFPHDVFAFETNMSGSLEIMKDIQKICAERRIHCPIYGKDVSRKLKKEDRLRFGLSPMLKQGKIKFKDTPMNRMALSQWRIWPSGKHDDGLDGFFIGVLVAKDILKRK